MPIRQTWNEAIAEISEANDAFAERILEPTRTRFRGAEIYDRETIAKKIQRPPAKQSSEVLEGQTPEDMNRLVDCVLWLIWCKLKDNDNKAYPGSFADPPYPPTGRLSVETVRRHLRERGYATADVQELLESSPKYSGTLRQWLGKQKVRSREDPKKFDRLYHDGVIELYLFEREIEELRWNPPKEILERIFEGCENARQRDAESEKWRKQKDHELLRRIGACIPLLMQGWAEIIARQLVTGTCTCPEDLAPIPLADEQLEGQNGPLDVRDDPDVQAQFNERCKAEDRCRYRHFLCRENVENAKQKRLPYQKKTYQDEFEYVERAVIEQIANQINRAFVETMLANIFRTPRGGRLVTRAFDGKIAVVETPRLWQASESAESGDATDREDRDEREKSEQQSARFVDGEQGDQDLVELIPNAEDDNRVAGDTIRRHPLLGCGKCEKILTNGHNCAGHKLGYATIGSDKGTGAFRARVNVCQARHVWISQQDTTCPACGKDAVRCDCEIELYQTDVPFDDIDWEPTLPRV